MKKVLIAAIGGMATAWASLAQAADLPYNKAAPTSYDYPPAFTWTGAYIGVNAGMGFGGFNSGAQHYFGSGPLGGVYGLTGGYNYQSGKLVLGGEVDYAFSHIADSASPFAGASSTGVVENFFTARARFGYAADRLLVYGTGGYAGGNLRGALFGPGIGYDSTHFANGFALGLGAEFAITPHFTAKAEYIYSSLGGSNYFSGTGYNTSSGVNLNLLRAGVNYHF